MINVLSLFDGMACGRLALERAGVPVAGYFASEIDKHAMFVAKKNWSDIEHVGSVINLWSWELPKIDLLIGGSPCQGFSFAGKQLAFDDPRSKLFFEYVRLYEALRERNPKIKFLLENVNMKKEHLQVITDILGVKPIKINSALVTAQNRVRWYWTNIPGVKSPKDKGIYLKDILETAASAEIHGGAIRGRYINGYSGETSQRIETVGNPKANAPTTVQKDSVCVFAGMADINGHDILKRVYRVEGKCPALTAASGGNQEKKIAVDQIMWRNLSVTECERLQTVPDGYTAGVSDTQRRKMLGNGWTVDIIAHIFSFMKEASPWA